MWCLWVKFSDAISRYYMWQDIIQAGKLHQIRGDHAGHANFPTLSLIACTVFAAYVYLPGNDLCVPV